MLHMRCHGGIILLHIKDAMYYVAHEMLYVAHERCHTGEVRVRWFRQDKSG